MDHRQAWAPNAGLDILALGISDIIKHKLSEFIDRHALNAGRNFTGQRFLIHLSSLSTGSGSGDLRRAAIASSLPRPPSRGAPLSSETACNRPKAKVVAFYAPWNAGYAIAW